MSGLKEKIAELVCSDSVLIACIGTELRNDDRAGLEVCRGLKRLGLENHARVIECEFGLETCVDKVAEERPKRLVVVDAVLTTEGSEAGGVIIAKLEDVVEGFLATTHNVPLSMMVKYLRALGCCEEVYVLGVVAKNLDFGEELSPEVMKGVEKLVNALAGALSSCSEDRVS